MHLRISERGNSPDARGIKMEWITPEFEEIALNCEINSYACASL
jgi:coenzyme PQQ precursor peptide PqqA